MEICPKCFQTMNNSHGDTTSKTIWLDKQQQPILTMVCDVSEDSINKIADAVVQKLTERSE